MSNTNQIKEVILHAGLHKTGSSSLQKTFYNEDNNALLQDAGMLYPRCLGQNHGVALYGAFSDNPKKYFTTRWHQAVSEEEVEAYNRLNLDKLKTSIQDHLQQKDTNKLLLSGEQLSRLSSKNLEALKTYLQEIGLDSAEFKVILYTRDPVSWTGSMAQQKLKEGSSYESLIKKDIATLFQNRLGNVMEVFGKDTMQVYSFEQARDHELGLIGHFLEKAGIDRETIKQLNEMRVNESITLFTGELLDYTRKKVPMRIKGEPNPKRQSKDYKPLKKMRGDKFTLSHEDKQRIQSNAAEDMIWLKSHFQIDYTQSEIKNEAKYKHIEASLEDVKAIYPKLSKVLRHSLIEFMEDQLITDVPPDNVKQCQDVIRDLKAQEFQLMEQKITKLNKKVKHLNKEVKQHKKEKQAIQTKFDNILNSKSWKLTSPLRKTMEIVNGQKSK